MSSVNPTPDELSLISTIFSIADPQNLGIVTGDAAVRVLSGANLPTSVLGEVWSLADKENNGFLTKNGLATAVRLIGYAQKGQSITDPNLLSKPGPLAVIDGVTPPPKASSDRPETSLPPLTQQDKSKFLKLFVSCGPSNGLLSSEKARDIFIRSKLPYEKLSQIWNLADSKVRGALDATDFIVGMYFLQACMAQSSFVLPSTLPPSIYEQASLIPDSSKSVTSHATGNSFSGSSASFHTPTPILKQLTGQSPSISVPATVRPQYTGQQVTSVSPGPTARSAQGDSFPQTKLPSDIIFEQLDTQHKGYIEADVAVPFMLKTGLSSTDLAQIWDLADINNDGRLTRQGFAVAMRLISSKTAGIEIPKTLPSNIASSPASTQLQFPNATAASDFDLLFDSSSSAAVQPQQTGGSNQRVPQNGGVFTSPPPVSPLQRLQFQSLPQQQSPPPVPAQTFDLLGDDEDTKAAVPDHSVEIGNLRNQLSSTTRSHEIAKTEKQSAEKTVQQQAEELAQLQTQLATARASYEMETKLLGDLRERTLTQQADISKMREELITAEGGLSSIKAERNDIQSALLSDKEEVRELQRKLREVGAETESLKAELEKLKRDARQQKGLLAIAKKQLATAESEKSKVQKEVETAEAELDDITKEKDFTETKVSELASAAASSSSGEGSLSESAFKSPERGLSPVPSVVAATVPLPSTPAPSSPPMSRQSTNPFDLLILGGALNSPSAEANGSVDAKAHVTSPSSSVSPVRAKSPLADVIFTQEDTAQQSDHKEATTTFVDKFPEVEVPRSLSPEAAVPRRSTSETSVEEQLSPLREIEDERDTSSDSEDEEPLSIIKEKVSNAAANGTLSQTHDRSDTRVNGSPAPEPPRQATFDLFDLSEPNPAAAALSGSEPQVRADSFSADADDPFGVPISPASPIVPVNEQQQQQQRLSVDKAAFDNKPAASATLKDFDEGFSNMSQPNKEASYNPKFDFSFDDHFDFAKVAAEENEHRKVEPQAANQFSVSGNESRVPDFSLDAFSTKPFAIDETLAPASPPAPAPAPTLVGGKLPPVEQQPPITFDDIFQVPTQTTASDAPSTAPSVSAATNIQQENAISASPVPAQATGNTNPFPSSFSDEFEQQRAFNSSPTPQRPYSPPIRPSSPPRQAPRISIGLAKNNTPPPPPGGISPKSKSSGSNIKASENKPEHTSKHKLALRLFGKKDKKDKDKEEKRGQPKHQNQSLDSQQASPAFAEPFTTGIVSGTPAVDDDVEPVKQLSAMGFSRSQAVAALEAHGYDMQRALNSLLGVSS